MKTNENYNYLYNISVSTCLERRNFWKRTRITIIFTIYKYPHMIEATTWIGFVPVWLYSLFDISQNVNHINKQLLCWKSRSTCTIFFSIWILVKFCYSIYTWQVIMFLVKQNIHWWYEWLVISQMFLFAITSISISRITRALCIGKLFH